jgi:hypothetical protein
MSTYEYSIDCEELDHLFKVQIDYTYTPPKPYVFEGHSYDLNDGDIAIHNVVILSATGDDGEEIPRCQSNEDQFAEWDDAATELVIDEVAEWGHLAQELVGGEV